MRFFVFPNISHSVILGLPFLYKYKVVLDFRRRTCHSFHKSVEVAALTATHIPPQQSALLAVSLRSSTPFPDGLQGVIVGRVRRNGLHVISSASTVLHNQCLVTVCNRSDSLIRVPHDSIVGHFRPLASDELFDVNRNALPSKSSQAFLRPLSVNAVSNHSHSSPHNANPAKSPTQPSPPESISPSSDAAHRHLKTEYKFKFDNHALTSDQFSALQTLLYNN